MQGIPGNTQIIYVSNSSGHKTIESEQIQIKIIFLKFIILTNNSRKNVEQSVKDYSSLLLLVNIIILRNMILCRLNRITIILMPIWWYVYNYN